MVVSRFKNTLNENISKYRASIVKVLSKYSVVEMLEKISCKKLVSRRKETLNGRFVEFSFVWKKNLLILNLDIFCEKENGRFERRKRKKNSNLIL